MIREAFQDLNRVRQIATIAARHGFADLLERSGLSRLLGRKEEDPSPETRRESVARRFRQFLNDLGPTFIKLGQVLSTRADMLPAEFIDELATLQDNVAPIPMEQIAEQIRRSFGKEPAELFQQIDPKPLAAASIAQVHRALTREGDEVVVKVQRPEIADQIRADLSVLHYLARALEAVVEEVGVYTPTGIVEEFDRAIHEELDFIHEASNLRAFYKTHVGRAYIRIPRVYDELSSRTVLTMEFIRGTKLSQLDLTQADREAIARNIVEASFRQLFEDGLFHGDPHPGNLLVLDGNVLALLDFGIVGRLTKQMQDTLVSLMLSIALKDAESVARILYRIGSPDSRANLLGFKSDIEQILGQYLPAKLRDVDSRHLLSDLLDLAIKYKIRVPKEYAILSRAAISTEGILRSLYPDLNIGEMALPYAKQLLAERYDPTQLQGGLMKTLLRIQSIAQDLPMQLSQIMLDLEAGKFSVTIRADQLDRVNANLRSLAAISFLGLCVCGFIIGAFIAFASRPPSYDGVPILGVLGALAAGALFGAAAAWYFFTARLRKLSLRSWLKRRP